MKSILEDGGHQARPDDAGDGGGHLVEARERDEHRGAVGEARVEAQRGLGGEGQRALGADDELGEVVAGGGLHELAARGDGLAGAEHRGEPEHLVARDAVAHRPHAASVGGHVAAEAGRVLAGEHGVDQPDGGGGLVELGEGDPGLDPGDVVVEVELEDLGHAVERHEHAVGLGDARSREARARAPRRDGSAVLGGGDDDGRHLLGGGRSDDGGRAHRAGGDGLVVGQVLRDGVAGGHVGRADDVLECADEITHEAPFSRGRDSMPRPGTSGPGLL